MEDMTQVLEQLLLCTSLDDEERDCVEQALDDGYAALNAADKSKIRRLLNQRAANPSHRSALQRYRARRQASTQAARRPRAAAGSSQQTALH